MKIKVDNHRIAVMQSNVTTRPRVSLTTLIRAYFHYADQTSAAAHHTLSTGRCPLFLYTSLFGTLAPLHTHTALPTTHFLTAVCHIFFLQRTHSWWDHTPGPGAGLYYVWVVLSSRCLVSVFFQRSGEMPSFYQRLTEVCQRCGAGGTGSFAAQRKPGSCALWAPRLLCWLSVWICFRQASHGGQLCWQWSRTERGGTCRTAHLSSPLRGQWAI